MGVFEIGGADAVSYREIMREYARQRGLRRWLIPVFVTEPSVVTRILSHLERRKADARAGPWAATG